VNPPSREVSKRLIDGLDTFVESKTTHAYQFKLRFQDIFPIQIRQEGWLGSKPGLLYY